MKAFIIISLTLFFIGLYFWLKKVYNFGKDNLLEPIEPGTEEYEKALQDERQREIWELESKLTSLRKEHEEHKRKQNYYEMNNIMSKILTTSSRIEYLKAHMKFVEP